MVATVGIYSSDTPEAVQTSDSSVTTGILVAISFYATAQAKQMLWPHTDDAGVALELGSQDQVKDLTIDCI